MTTALILLTVLSFAGGIALSIWQTRRRIRAQMADRLAREVERELARRVVADIRRGNAATRTPPDTP